MWDTWKLVAVIVCLCLALAVACVTNVTITIEGDLEICRRADKLIQMIKAGKVEVKVNGNNMTPAQQKEVEKAIKKAGGAHSGPTWGKILKEMLKLAKVTVRDLASQDSVYFEVNMVRDTLAEAELEELYPISGRHWFVFKIDPADTSGIIFPEYDSADVEVSYTLQVALVDSPMYSVPDSIAIITSNFPDFNPETGEILEQWSEPTYRGSIPIEDLGSCEDIPTLTEWGLIIFGVVLLGFITWVFLRRRKAVVSLR